MKSAASARWTTENSIILNAGNHWVQSLIMTAAEILYKNLFGK